MLNQIYLLISLLIGFVLGWVILYQLKRNEKDFLVKANQEQKQELSELNQQITQLNYQLGLEQSEKRSLESSLSQQKEQLLELQKHFREEFENLANRIFEEKSIKFEQQNQKSLSNILDPLSEKIKAFEKKVEEVYYADGKERASLKEQIVQLSELNKQMNNEAQNLTKALTGDSKAQGNWGEMVMERILEKSGLQEGREYVLQANVWSENGKLFRPDVVITLPQNKVLILDSKISLTAYERFISSQNSEEQERYKREHLASLRAHIKGLSDKNYASLYKDSQSLDFVLLFIPIESAFALTLKEDSEIFEEALSKNIVIVCPSTLLATMRTVKTIWQIEQSNRNVQEIAKLGGEVYDRVKIVIDRLDDLGTGFKTTQNKFDLVMTGLQGKQGLIKSAIKLKELGAKTNKELNTKLLEIE